LQLTAKLLRFMSDELNHGGTIYAENRFIALSNRLKILTSGFE